VNCSGTDWPPAKAGLVTVNAIVNLHQYNYMLSSRREQHDEGNWHAARSRHSRVGQLGEDDGGEECQSPHSSFPGPAAPAEDGCNGDSCIVRDVEERSRERRQPSR
jgi:hypothetical protein